MRKLMTKEVTTTIIKSGKILIDKDGSPIVQSMPELTKLGEFSRPKAQKLINKEYGLGVSIYSIETKTQVYEMEVEEFIKIAKIRGENEETSEEEEQEEEEKEEEQEEKQEEETQKGRVRRIAKVEA
jgi:hypothetical protein